MHQIQRAVTGRRGISVTLVHQSINIRSHAWYRVILEDEGNHCLAAAGIFVAKLALVGLVLLQRPDRHLARCDYEEEGSYTNAEGKFFLSIHWIQSRSSPITGEATGRRHGMRITRVESDKLTE